MRPERLRGGGGGATCGCSEDGERDGSGSTMGLGTQSIGIPEFTSECNSVDPGIEFIRI